MVSWEVDRALLRDACERLVVRYNVIVTPAKLPDRVKGRYCGFDYVRKVLGHDIRISRYLSPEDASRCLWHELTHVSQFEDSPSTFYDEYERYDRKYKQLLASGVASADAYLSNPFEAAAKANERLHDEVGSLMLTKAGVDHIDTFEAQLKRAANLSHIQKAADMIGLSS
jgi:hypothetical protein